MTAVDRVVNAAIERAHALCIDTPSKPSNAPVNHRAQSVDQVPLRSNRKSSQPRRSRNPRLNDDTSSSSINRDPRMDTSGCNNKTKASDTARKHPSYRYLEIAKVLKRKRDEDNNRSDDDEIDSADDSNPRQRRRVIHLVDEPFAGMQEGSRRHKRAKARADQSPSENRCTRTRTMTASRRSTCATTKMKVS